MDSPADTHDAIGSFERAYQIRVLRNEETYATLFALFLVAVTFFVTSTGVLTRIYVGPNPAPWLLGFVAAAVILLATLRRQARRAREGVAPFPAWIQYVEVPVTASLFSAALWVEAAGFEHPYYSLFGPHAMFAAVWIVVTGLRMKPWIPIAAGSLTGAGYLAASVSMYSTISEGPLPPPFHELAPQAVRAFSLVVLGALAALLNAQLRKAALAAVAASVEKAQVLRAFGQNVSPAVAEELLRRGDKPVNESRFVVVMFLDVRGFTTFSESRTPEEVVRGLESLFAFMAPAIEGTGGVVNKFLGDGFMAVWGAPIVRKPEECCRAAVFAARRILAELDDAVAAKRAPALGVGIGIHAGEAVVGSVGTESRSEYTVIGDVVNVASRVEQLNKQLESRLLVTGPVWQHLDDEKSAEVHDGISVKGRLEALQIYELE